MNHSTIDMELKFLSAQEETVDLPEIQRLSAVQLAALASTLGRKHGIKIEFGPFNTAATNGSRIVMPLASKANSWLVRGYLDHELGHVRLTDFDIIPEEGFRRSLWNVLEDIRIESAMPLHYPGMATNYRILMRELARTSPDFFVINEFADPDNKIVAYISLMLRVLYLRQAEQANNAINAREVFITTFGDALERDLFQVIMKIGNAKDPQDVLDMVDEIIALLESHVEMSPQDDHSDEDTAQKDDPDQSAGIGDDADNTGSDSGDNAQPEVGDEDNPGQATDETQTRCSNHQDSPSLQELLQKALESPGEIPDLGDQLRLLAERNEYQSGHYGKFDIARAATEDELYTAGYEPYPVTTSSVLVATLSSRLRGLLQAMDLKQATPGASGNRLARNRLHRIKTGDPRLFLKKTPQKMVRTAFHVLLDNSGSMNDFHRFRKARDVLLAMVKALGPISGVNLGVSIFPAFYPYYKTEDVNIPVATVVRHHRNPASHILYPVAPNGGTPLGPSLRYVTSSMLGLTEPRKIIFIITDGDPDGGDGSEIAIQEAVDLGFEVVALGIEELAYLEIFPHAEILTNLQELPQKTFSLLEKLLLLN